MPFFCSPEYFDIFPQQNGGQTLPPRMISYIFFPLWKPGYQAIDNFSRWMSQPRVINLILYIFFFSSASEQSDDSFHNQPWAHITTIPAEMQPRLSSMLPVSCWSTAVLCSMGEGGPGLWAERSCYSFVQVYNCLGLCRGFFSASYVSVSFLILLNDFPDAIGRGPRRDCFPLLRGKQEWGKRAPRELFTSSIHLCQPLFPDD